VVPLQNAFHLVKAGLTEFRPRRLFITGHSLGGAFATLAAFVLGLTKPTGIESIHIISFGSPTLLSDGARNTFNAILDSGYMTLDRVVSHFGNYMDPISLVPSGFTHPGFQPLKSEMYPEMKTGRAYHLDTIKKVFVGQTGGLLGLGKEKGAYEALTKTHVPNKVMVPVLSALWKTFPHAEYMDMTYAGGQRIPGLKNPGFKNHTFIADFSDAGLVFKYVDAKPGDVPMEDAKADDGTLTSLGNPTGVQTNSNGESVEAENSVEIHTSAFTSANGKRTLHRRKALRKNTRKLRR
jgi:hypothetical protein